MDSPQAQIRRASFTMKYRRDRGFCWEDAFEDVYVQRGAGFYVRRLADGKLLAFDIEYETAMMIADGKLTDLARERDGISVARVG